MLRGEAWHVSETDSKDAIRQTKQQANIRWLLRSWPRLSLTGRLLITASHLSTAVNDGLLSTTEHNRERKRAELPIQLIQCWFPGLATSNAVSYTHLTLPTILRV